MTWWRTLWKKSTAKEYEYKGEIEGEKFPITIVKEIKYENSRTYIEFYSLEALEEYLEKIGYKGEIYLTDDDRFIVLIQGFVLVVEDYSEERNTLYG
jgi:hypothetical protein